MNKNLVLIAAVLLTALSVICFGYSTIAYYFLWFYTTDMITWGTFFCFFLLFIIYAMSAAYCFFKAWKPSKLPKEIKTEHQFYAASILGFLAVIPLSVTGNFFNNSAAVILIALIGGVAPILIMLFLEQKENQTKQLKELDALKQENQNLKKQLETQTNYSNKKKTKRKLFRKRN